MESSDSVIQSLKGIDESFKTEIKNVGISTSITALKDQLQSTAEEIEPIIKSSDFDGIKKEMVELAGSINTKKIVIPIPMGGNDDSRSSAVPVGAGSGRGVKSKGVNSSREMYHNLITLITSYT